MRGLRVVDVSESIAGAYCSRLFATTGADVVCVEPTGGSPLRRRAPLIGDRSALWEYLAAGKRGVSFSAGDRRLDQLLRWADLVVSSCDGDPDAARAFHDRVAALDPSTVHVVTSGYGLTGPYRSWRHTDFTDWAAGGHLFITGEPDREPLQGGGPWLSYLAGAVAAIGAQAAVLHATRTGEGQLVDVGAMEAAASLHQWTITMYTHTGCIKRRWGNLLGESSHPVALYRCADGYISVVAVASAQWEALCLTMELFDLLADPALEVIAERFDRAAEIDARINAWLATRTAADAVALLQAAGVPATRLLTMADVLDEPQLEARRYWATVPGLGEGGSAPRMPWLPFRLDGADVAFRRAPAVGEHDDEVSAALAAPPDDRVLPAIDLGAVRLLEFGVAWAGPLAGRFLAELGVEVVKVEHPASRGLPVNAEFAEGWHWGELPHPQIRFPVFPDATPGERWWNRSGMFNKMNRGKRSVSVDAKAPEGRRILDALLASSDVVLHNYSPRGAASLGIDAAGARAANPMAVTVSMSGYGETGPLASYLSYGPILQAHAGFDEATGYIGGGPTRLGVAFPDPVGGVHGAFAVLAALWERALTDHPVHVDLAQLETLLAIGGDLLLATSITGRAPARHGNRSPDHSPQNVYRCAGDDRWVAVTVTSDEQWRRLVDALHDPALDGLRAAAVHERRAHEEVVDAAITRWTVTMTPAGAAHACQALGVAASAVMTNGDLADDPHLRERGFVALIDQPDVGRRRFPGSPLHLSRTPVRVRPAPPLGEGNADLVGPLLGYDAGGIADLKRRAVLASRPLYR